MEANEGLAGDTAEYGTEIKSFLPDPAIHSNKSTASLWISELCLIKSVFQTTYQQVLRQSHILLRDGVVCLPMILDVAGVVAEAADLKGALLGKRKENPLST